MAVTVIGMVLLRSLTSVVILSGAYSFLMATVMVALDAPDVAMTEAAVGAGVSTVLLLGAVALVGAKEALPKRPPILALAVSIGTAALLVWGTIDLPALGSADSAPNTHVAPTYLQNAVAETKAPNVVAAVLASYRGYDTLGEVVVILTAGFAVLLLIGGARSREGRVAEPDLMIRIATKILIPFILIFALYVQFHGEYGPGGGFQAGVAVAASVILYALIFGLAPAQRAAPLRGGELLMASGAVLYAGVGIVSLMLGVEYLNYSVLGPDAPSGQKIGIMVIEFGVLLTVTGTIIAIYYAIAGRRHA